MYSTMTHKNCPTISLFSRQCVDVYDEKCETKYPAKCSEDQSCTMLYQTKCENVGYSQKCQQVPVRKCQSITKCHRIPKTTCRPFKKEKCGNKAIPTPVKKLKHKCLPYEAKPSENLASCGVKNNNSPSSGYGAPGNGNNPSSGYGAPGNNNNPSSGYRAPQGNNKPSYSGQNNAIPRPPPPPTVADMLAPIGPMPSNNQGMQFICSGKLKRETNCIQKYMYSDSIFLLAANY